MAHTRARHRARGVCFGASLVAVAMDVAEDPPRANRSTGERMTTQSRAEFTEAVSSIKLSLDLTRRFPRNVFCGEWSTFFFDSDWILDAAFVETVKALLLVEGSACACLMNVDRPTSSERDRLFFIEADTTPDSYQALLGREPPDGWVYDFGRFGCSSNLGQWVMYCEHTNEIAVIGLRSGVRVEPYAPILARFGAARIGEAIRLPLSYGFSPDALTPQWRNELLREYAWIAEAGEPRG